MQRALLGILSGLCLGLAIGEARPKTKSPPKQRTPLMRQKPPVVIDLPVPVASHLPIGTSLPDVPLETQKLEGIIAGPPRQRDFFLRANGFVYLVRPYSPGLLSIIEGGDGVRIFGTVNGLNITNANIRILQKRASSKWDDYAPSTSP